MAEEVRTGVTRGGENWGHGGSKWEGEFSPRICYALKNSDRVLCYLFNNKYTHQLHVFVKALFRLLLSPAVGWLGHGTSGSATQTGSPTLAV